MNLKEPGLGHGRITDTPSKGWTFGDGPSDHRGPIDQVRGLVGGDHPLQKSLLETVRLDGCLDDLCWCRFEVWLLGLIHGQDAGGGTELGFLIEENVRNYILLIGFVRLFIDILRA